MRLAWVFAGFPDKLKSMFINKRLRLFFASLFLGSLLLMAWPSAVFANELCARTPEDFARIEQQLPAILRGMPLMFSAEKQKIFIYEVSVALQFLAAPNGRLKVQGYVLKDDELEIDESYVKEACFRDNKLVMVTDSGSEYKVDVRSQEIVVKRVVLRREHENSRFLATVSRIHPTAPNSSTATTSSATSRPESSKGVQ